MLAPLRMVRPLDDRHLYDVLLLWGNEVAQGSAEEASAEFGDGGGRVYYACWSFEGEQL